MFFHLFKKSYVSKNGKKSFHWFYWYYVPVTNIRKQKSCINPDGSSCSNKSEAEKFISDLPVPDKKTSFVCVHDIVKNMYIPGSKHYDRMVKYGRKLAEETLISNRRYVLLFDKLWGKLDICELTAPVVDSYLLDDKHSGSWKNSFIQIMNEVIQEAQWYGVTLIPPCFHRFARNSKKPDVFSTSELNAVFQRKNFPDDTMYLFFYTTVSAGLRLGEIRALRSCQILSDKNIIIVDGFCKRDKAATRTNYNKKGSEDNPKFRVTVVPSEIITELERYILNHGIAAGQLIFTRNGKAIEETYCRSVFKKAITMSGIDTENKRFVPHSCRYTYVTRMRRSLDAETVQNLVGHTAVEMTEAYNRAALPELIQSADTVKIKQSAENLFD